LEGASRWRKKEKEEKIRYRENLVSLDIMPKADRVKLDKGWWYCGPYDEHEYVVYECGCNFHKVIELMNASHAQSSGGVSRREARGFRGGSYDERKRPKIHEARKKWSFCKHHLKKLDKAKEVYNTTWNSIMEGKVSKRSKISSAKNRRSLPNIEEIDEKKA
jgi:hypothetical protein